MIKFLLNAPLEYLRCSDIENVIKILNVLEYICRVEKDCSVSDIVTNCNVDKHKICKWLEAFVESGYIKKDKKTDRYYPTLKTVNLGNCIVKNIKTRKFTSGEIKRYSSMEESAHLSMYDNNQSIIIDKIESKTDHNGETHINR